jgi:hypothetical protein
LIVVDPAAASALEAALIDEGQMVAAVGEVCASKGATVELR